MASCAQIEAMLQTYVDGELGHSDKVILKQHISDCRACSALLRKHERMCAGLFEVLADDRLRRDLAPSIMEHLPEMERDPLDVQTVNWRVKHALDHWGTIARVAPLGVGAVLLVVAFTLMSQWPRGTPLEAAAIGVVTHSSGEATAYLEDAKARQSVQVKDFVLCGQHYETGAADALMLTLAGPTQVKLNENTRISVLDARTLRLETGQIWADVDRGNRLFRVFTPVGGVTVMGTAFDIAVERNKATVTVARGSVQVDNEAVFSRIEPGQQVDLAVGQKALVSRKADVAAITAWTVPIVPDKNANDLFEQKITPKGVVPVSSYQVGLVYMDQTRTVKGVYFQWEPDTLESGHCGYDVYVFERKTPIFKGHVSGEVFDNKATRFYEVPVPGEPIRGVKRLDIKVVPDRSGGSMETEFSEISGSCI